jgi:uncharacterized membrane protein YhaH (DUF805 family)
LSFTVGSGVLSVDILKQVDSREGYFMGFMDAVKTCLNKYASIEGRASRSEYWWFYLFTMIVGLVPYFLGAIAGSSILIIIGGIIILGLMLPGICAGIRRLHDHDKSGWWMLIALVPIVSLVLLYWFVIRGTVGPNQFGPDPVA